MAESEVDQFTMSEFPKWLRSYFVENPSIPMKLRGVCPMELQLVLPVQEIHNQWVSVFKLSRRIDYYGKLVDIIQLSYPWDKVVTLFKCEWLDNSPRGTKMDKHGNIEIHWTRRYTVGYDPFILAQQSGTSLLYIIPHIPPRLEGVIKTKARNIIPKSKEPESNDGMAEPFQVDVEHVLPINIFDDEVPSNLFDSAAGLELIPIQIDDEESTMRKK
ncbi:hypothetical protein K1719_007799 [Acacia pycnantha]|nr:hypothetical protein K1719_007799 [Acacia pycnantha]